MSYPLPPPAQLCQFVTTSFPLFYHCMHLSLWLEETTSRAVSSAKGMNVVDIGMMATPDSIEIFLSQLREWWKNDLFAICSVFCDVCFADVAVRWRTLFAGITRLVILFRRYRHHDTSFILTAEQGHRI